MVDIAADSWNLAQSHSNVYWDAVQKVYETDPDPDQTLTDTNPLPKHLHEWPSTKYDEFYADVVTSMKTHMGATHSILTRMADLKPNRDMKKLLPWLVFWETVYHEHKQPYLGNPAYQFGTDPILMNYPDHDLQNATNAMDAAIDAVNLVITMDVVLCLDIKWPLAIVAGRNTTHGAPPKFIHWLWSEPSVTIDQFTEEVWGALVGPSDVPPPLKVTDATTGKVVQTRDELLAAYPFVKGSFAPPSKPSKPSKPVTPSSGGSADSSSGGIWILLLLLLVAGMYLYSK